MGNSECGIRNSEWEALHLRGSNLDDPPSRERQLAGALRQENVLCAGRNRELPLAAREVSHPCGNGGATISFMCGPGAISKNS